MAVSDRISQLMGALDAAAGDEQAVAGGAGQRLHIALAARDVGPHILSVEARVGRALTTSKR